MAQEATILLEKIAVDTMAALPLFAELRGVMGRGEAACLALAATGGFHVASDEKKRFRRKAIGLIGEARILGTEFLLREAIRRDQITIGEADHLKDILAANNYALPFNSFADIGKSEREITCRAGDAHELLSSHHVGHGGCAKLGVGRKMPKRPPGRGV